MRNGSSVQLLLQRSRHSRHLLAQRSFFGTLLHCYPIIDDILHRTTHIRVVASLALLLKPLMQWFRHGNRESFKLGFRCFCHALFLFYVLILVRYLPTFDYFITLFRVKSRTFYNRSSAIFHFLALLCYNSSHTISYYDRPCP